MTRTLSLRQLNRATLARQMLLEREKATPIQALDRLCGMHAQDPRPPFIGLWTRVAGFEPDDLRTAYQSRKVVRATLMRGTIHAMSAREYVELRTPLQPALDVGLQILGDRADGLEIDKVLPVARRLFKKEPRNFKEMRALLKEKFPEVNDRALGYSTRLTLPLVMVPTDDRWSFPSVADFTLADEWLGKKPKQSGNPKKLIRRYLAAFGPASPADFQTWSGLRGMKSVFEGMRDEFEVFKAEGGRELFDLPDAPRPDGDTPAPLRFLPDFDNLILSHQDRTRVITDERRAAITGKNGRYQFLFLWDGFAAGTWKVESKKSVATLSVTPFKKVRGMTRKAFAEEGEKLLTLLEPDVGSYEIRLLK